METLRTFRAALDALPPPAPLGVLFADHLHRILARCLQTLDAEQYDALVVHAGLPVHAFLDDQAYPYRVNPHFAWWVPHADSPGSLLHIRPGRRPLLAFVAPRDYWHAPPSLPREAWVHQFDVVEYPSHAAALAALDIGPRTAFIGPPLGAAPAAAFAAMNPERLLVRLHDHRTRKTAWEVHQHRIASLRAARGHQAAAAAFRSGATEREIHATFLATAGARESELPYGAIVATGANAATLHYQHLADDSGPPASMSRDGPE
ncbi:MAG: M24 family metallopeptidase, partial [Sphingomonadales bacterium]